MRIALRKRDYLKEYFYYERKYNRLVESVIDLYDIKEAGFAKHNRHISMYVLKAPEHLIQALIFCVASQGVPWNKVASLYRKMYQVLKLKGSLYYLDKNEELRYSAEGWKELLGGLGKNKISAIEYMWKNQYEIFKTTKHILEGWKYDDNKEKSRDAVLKLFDYFTSLKGLGIVKAGFAVQLVVGALGCFDSINTKLYSSEDIPKDMLKGLFSPSGVAKPPSDSKDFNDRVQKLILYSNFLDLLAKEVQKPTSERLWDIWVTIVADRIRNISSKDKTILTRGDQELAVLSSYDSIASNPDIYNWEQEHKNITPEEVTKQHHPYYLAYGKYPNYKDYEEN